MLKVSKSFFFLIHFKHLKSTLAPLVSKYYNRLAEVLKNIYGTPVYQRSLKGLKKPDDLHPNKTQRDMVQQGAFLTNCLLSIPASIKCYSKRIYLKRYLINILLGIWTIIIKEMN